MGLCAKLQPEQVFFPHLATHKSYSYPWGMTPRQLFLDYIRAIIPLLLLKGLNVSLEMTSTREWKRSLRDPLNTENQRRDDGMRAPPAGHNLENTASYRSHSLSDMA